MTLLIADGFDHPNDPSDKYTVSGTPTFSSTTRSGSGRSILLNGTNEYVEIAVPTIATTFFMGLAIRDVEGIPSITDLIRFVAAAGGQSEIGWDGKAFFWRRLTTTLQRSVGPFTVKGAWYYLEVKVTISNSISANECQIRLNGLEILNLATSSDTQTQASADVDLIRIFGGANNADILIDDLYIVDDNGSKNNTFLGDVRVETLYPDGNGATSNFTGSDADSIDNYLHVDEAQQDGDTSYVEDNTVSNIDLYTFDDLASTPDTIHSIVVDAYTKKDDAGVRTGKHLIRRNGTNYEGTAFSPSNGSYTYSLNIWEDDPEIAGAWTETNLNGAEVGVKVET